MSFFHALDRSTKTRSDARSLYSQPDLHVHASEGCRQNENCTAKLLRQS